ncbi:hypothetical protein [Dactylosporangium sp. CA-139066]|uniref:hypothetical protein n=1 Tax=Dactylosporangium sp. CA-139066 TaxID=3239930 RepID=UPI003D8DA2A3
MRKHRVLTALLAGSLVLGAAGCDALRRGDDMETVSVDVADDGGAEHAALAALGVSLPGSGLDAAAGPAASASAGPGGKNALRHRIRVRLRKHMLHGEVVVQTKDGPQTVVVQRGTVTAKGDGSVTVKSTDGFTLTWTTNDTTKVAAGGRKAALDQVVLGAQVGIGGVKSDPQVARLVVVPKQQS